MRVTDRNSAIPVYQQIASDILSRIASGEWEIGSQIDSENTLCEEYEASRVTVRQALTKLKYEGYIDRRQGQGSFVKAKPEIETLDLFIPQVGVRKKSDITSANIVLQVDLKPSALVREKLHLKENDPVAALTREFMLHGRVIGIHHAWFPLSRVAGITEVPLENNSITDTLQNRYNITFSAIENYIESISLDGETAAMLNAATMTPSLKINSLYYDADEKAVEYSETIWNGRDTQFRIVISSK